MKILSTAMVILSVIFFSSAGAQIIPDPDVMGLYFDTAAEMMCINGVAPYSSNTLYLILTRPTSSSIQGFRAGVELGGPGVFLGVDYPGEIIISDTYVGMQWVWPEPVPATDTTMLAEISVLYMSVANEPVYFFLGSFDPPMEGLPSLLLPNGTWIDADQYFGSGPVAAINAPCVTQTYSFTFDSLKSLYR